MGKGRKLVTREPNSEQEREAGVHDNEELRDYNNLVQIENVTPIDIESDQTIDNAHTEEKEAENSHNADSAQMSEQPITIDTINKILNDSFRSMFGKFREERKQEMEKQAERDKLQAERDKLLIEQMKAIQSEISEIKQVYHELPEKVANLSIDVQTLQTAHTSLKDEVQELTERFNDFETKCEERVDKYVNKQKKKIGNELQQWAQVKEQEISNEIDNKLQQALITINDVVIQSKVDDGTMSTGPEQHSIQPNINSEFHTYPRNSAKGLLSNDDQQENSKPEETTPNMHRKLYGNTSNFSGTNTHTNEYNNKIYNQPYGNGPVATFPGAVTTMPSVWIEESIVKHSQFQTFNADKKTTHPVIFIKSFRNTLPSMWTERQRIQFIISHLQGEASMWANEIIDKCISVEQFEKMFLAKYWSQAVQERLRMEVYSPERYNPKQGSLRRYFEKYINKTRYWDEPISNRDLIRILKLRLPGYIKDKLINVPESNMENYLSVIDAIDIAQEQERIDRELGNSYRSPKKNENRNGYGNSPNGSKRNHDNHGGNGQQQNRNGQQYFSKKRRYDDRFNSGYSNNQRWDGNVQEYRGDHSNQQRWNQRNRTPPGTSNQCYSNENRNDSGHQSQQTNRRDTNQNVRIVEVTNEEGSVPTTMSN